MFGTNPIRKQDLSSPNALRVQKIFQTIQGEGPFAGLPAVFLRLAGCNLRCSWCDTEFESQYDLAVGVDQVVTTVLQLAGEKIRLVVLTGGEPLRQDIRPLCFALADYGFHVQIETAGTLWVDGLEEVLVQEGEGVSIVCSPKTPKVHERIRQHCHHWKYLIREGEVAAEDGLPNKSTQTPGAPSRLARPPRRTDTVWLQPCEAYRTEYRTRLTKRGEDSDQELTSSVRDADQTQKNIRLAAVLAMRFNYRISLQLHKLIGLE